MGLSIILRLLTKSNRNTPKDFTRLFEISHNFTDMEGADNKQYILTSDVTINKGLLWAED